MEFFVASIDTPGLLDTLTEHAPLNPFCSPGFFKAMRRLGSDPWIVGMMEGDQILSAAGAFLRRGRFNSTLEITSVPTAASTEEFWFGLLRFSAEHGITQIEANSYASSSMAIPVLKYETERRHRHEYVLDLPGLSVDRMSSNHRRNIRKAKSIGLMIRRSVDRDACREHVRLMNLSQDRRRRRGEEIADGPVMDEFLAFLESGCGELFQTVTATTVLSSVLILRSPSSAYYQSAGTAPEGMASGASHFLINGIAWQLREEGLRTFNIGGAPAESSLAKFKSDFGAAVVPLTSVSVYVGHAWRRKLTTLLRMARRDPRRLRSTLIGNLRLKKIYVRETSGVMVHNSIPSAEFRRLSVDDLHHLEVDDAGFRRRQLERLARFGRSYAYGVLVEGKVAHVSWLLPAAVVQTESPAILRLKDDQAEITACETLPEFRGKGIYGFAIRNLFEVSRQQGILRIYMKTAWDNKSSQRGIRSAGLQSAGVALLVVPPLLSGRTWVLRLYR